MHSFGWGKWLAPVLAVAVFIGGCSSSSDAARPKRSDSPPWLGLNYNDDPGAGAIEMFAAHGIVYDREGGVGASAGHTPQNSAKFAHGLRTAIRAGMVPDIEVDPGPNTTARVCNGNSNGSNICLPTRPSDVRAFVSGFVRTASSVLRTYPGRQVLFEPIDEPWNFAQQGGQQVPSGRVAAAQYAVILAQLLPAASAAGIPLTDVYIPATGRLTDGSSWIADLYAAQPCLGSSQSPCAPGAPLTPIEGWNIHPYGLPGMSSEGIDSLPPLRNEMRSGQNNIVASEIGFCDREDDSGNTCADNIPDIAGTSAQAVGWLTTSLRTAARMHRAGWLKAVIFWARDYPWDVKNRLSSGWSMQTPSGSLTVEGQALMAFAARAG